MDNEINEYVYDKLSAQALRFLRDILLAVQANGIRTPESLEEFRLIKTEIYLREKQ